jgi:hypothetical protein
MNSAADGVHRQPTAAGLLTMLDQGSSVTQLADRLTGPQRLRFTK